MKLRFSALLPVACALFLLASEIFACACCADRGHYSITTSKPDQTVLNELKKINFTTANLYAGPGFPENIRGLQPAGEKYRINGNLDRWNFAFQDERSKPGTLDLSRPVQMVSYMVDQNPTDDSNSVELYKEWRFKYKVKNASGIFAGGFDKTTEYFLVLQGTGNLCTSAEDFRHFRLEISGKKAGYMFYGGVSANPAGETADFKLKALKGEYAGCACSLQTLSEAAKSGKWKTFNFFAELGEPDAPGFFNFGGRDKNLKLKKAGVRPETEKVGDRYTDIYEEGGIEIKIEYIVSKLPCAECEGTDYDVIVTTTDENGQSFTEKALGSCGC